MHTRTALLTDIPRMHEIRIAVKENQLSDPDLVTEKDYKDHLLNYGKGWVAIQDEIITGFAIINLSNRNIWALFVHPDFESKGHGKRLHDTMLKSYFSEHNLSLWLGTAPATRAEKFYRLQGWKDSGIYGKNEIRFEMSKKTFSTKNRIG